LHRYKVTSSDREIDSARTEMLHQAKTLKTAEEKFRSKAEAYQRFLEAKQATIKEELARVKTHKLKSVATAKSTASAGLIQVSAKTSVFGKVIELTVDRYDTIATVKKYIRKRSKGVITPTGTQTLLYCGRVLEDDKIVDDYLIEAGSTLILVIDRGPEKVLSVSSSDSESESDEESASGAFSRRPGRERAGTLLEEMDRDEE
jgi:hypothetical protein